MNKNSTQDEAFGKAKLLIISSIAVISLLITITVYTPSLIYFSQREYFDDYFLSLIIEPFLYGLGVVLLFLAFLSIWSKHILKYLVSVLLVLAIMVWLQVDYFAVSYGVLDGAELNFEHFNSRGMVELIVLSLVVVFAIFFNQFVIKNVFFMVCLMMLGQLALVTSHVIQEPNDKEKSMVLDAEFHQYSSDKNVLLIILDTFGSEYFQTIIDSKPEILDEYTGFVSYTDAISNYPATRGSLPSMLTGQLIPESVKFKKFSKKVLKTDGMPKKFHDDGYLVSVMSTTNWLKDAFPQRYMSELTIDAETMSEYHAFQLFDYALFRASLHWFKPMLFDDGQWFLSKKISASTDIPNTPVERGRLLMETLVNEAQVKDQQARFKLMHLTIPHPEYVYDKHCQKNDEVAGWPVKRRMLEQSECALDQLNLLLSKYKALGIYDNSLIVVTSDHGARVFDDHHINGFPSQFELNASGIFFMIKGVNQVLPFRQVNQPFSLLKLVPALLNSELHESDYSQMFDDNRQFYAYQNWQIRANGYLPDAPIYQVRENYTDKSSWDLIDYGVNECSQQSLPLTMTFKTIDREGYCSLFGFDRPHASGNGVRTVGSDSRIVFNLNPESINDDSKYLVKFEFDAMLLTDQPIQELSLYLNDQLLGVQLIEGANKYQLSAEFNGDLLKNEKNVFQINVPGVTSLQELGVGNSPRRLGVLVRNLVVEEMKSG